MTVARSSCDHNQYIIAYTSGFVDDGTFSYNGPKDRFGVSNVVKVALLNCAVRTRGKVCYRRLLCYIGTKAVIEQLFPKRTRKMFELIPFYSLVLKKFPTKFGA